MQKGAKNRSAERWSGRLIADTILISPVGGREVNPLDGRRSIISILPVPKKLAQLLMDLARAGFVSRGGKGRELMQRGQFTRVVPNEVPLPTLETS